MMKFRFLGRQVKIAHQGRKYPIQKDEQGRSLRKRCFTLFQEGKKPREVAILLDMKLDTVNRYYSEWNQCPPGLEVTYRLLEKELKTKKELSPEIISMISTNRGIPKWEVVQMLSRPNGLKRLIKGDLFNQYKERIFNAQEQRLEAALGLVVLHEKYGMSLDWIQKEIKKMTQRAIKYMNTHKAREQDETMGDNIRDS
jgi:hypothetical protein